MKQFLKDNLAIVAAIALPAILVLVFALSNLMVTSTVPDPQYDFLFATNYNNYNNGQNEVYYYEVADGRLKISYNFPAKNPAGGYQYYNTSRLWRVHVPAMTVEEITLVPPAKKSDADDGTRVTLDVPAVAGLKLNASQPSPDGYTFQQSYDSSDNNLMMEIFAGSRNRGRNMCVIAKGGRAIPVKNFSGDYYYGYNTHFIGWVMKD
jgi:hypothetical protein